MFFLLFLKFKFFIKKDEMENIYNFLILFFKKDNT